MKFDRDLVTDKVSSTLGSWSFVLGQLLILALWILLGQFIHDPYPFLFLNLALGIISSLSAPLIMMSQNRQEARDSANELEDLVTDQANTDRLKRIEVVLDEIREQFAHASFPRRKYVKKGIDHGQEK